MWVIMKTLFGFLGTSIIAISLLSAAPVQDNCKCQNCKCTEESHCGCFSNSGSPGSCECGSECGCGK